jgi:hypothetical protein
MNENQKKVFYAFLSLLLILAVFQGIHSIYNNMCYGSKSQSQIIKEAFDNQYYMPYTFGDYSSDSSKQNMNVVSMPILDNAGPTCANMCGPSGRCSITGQQCTADIDCPGCQPRFPITQNTIDNFVPPDNDSGILTTEKQLNYSKLTSDIGTRARRVMEYSVSKNEFSTPTVSNALKSSLLGTSQWRSPYDLNTYVFSANPNPLDDTLFQK